MGSTALQYSAISHLQVVNDPCLSVHPGYDGVQWNTKPAWMTQGCGIGVKIFGETKGDLVNPLGMHPG